MWFRERRFDGGSRRNLLELPSLEALVGKDLRDRVAGGILEALELRLQLRDVDLHLLRENGQGHREHPGDADSDQAELGDHFDRLVDHERLQHLHEENRHHHRGNGQEDRTGQDSLGDTQLASLLGHAQLLTSLIDDGHTSAVPLLHTGEANVRAASSDNSQVRDERAQNLEGRDGADDGAGSQRNTAGRGHSQTVGLEKSRPVDGSARSVHVVVDGVVGLVQPLREHDLLGAIRHKHQSAERNVHGDERRHTARAEKLLASDRVQAHLDVLAGGPHLLVSQPLWLLAGFLELFQQSLRLLQVFAGQQQGARVNVVIHAHKPSVERRLVELRLVHREGGGRANSSTIGPSRGGDPQECCSC
mmetsp:Transcript_15511/g.33635  ORF Transcript_15511/g.33635 Transcript_15511/m.33635 type:complete len:361 (-) Transcript_15511:247-1329(-)